MNMTEKEGMRVFQTHLPVSLYRKLTEFSAKLEVSRSEIARNAIESFLRNKECKGEDVKNTD